MNKKPPHPITIRTDTEHMCIDGKWFDTRTLSEAMDAKIKELTGHRFPHQHRVPCFRTGTPYGQVLLELGVPQCPPPEHYQIVNLPKSTKTYGKVATWPAIFNLDEELHYA